MTTQRKPKTERRRVGAETEALLFDVSTKLFTAHGYNGVSIRQIADSCGITIPTLYIYFKDKRALYLACTLRIFEQATGRMLRSLDRPGPATERVFGATKMLAQLLLEDHDLVKIFQRELADADAEGLGLIDAQAFQEPLSKLHACIREAMGEEPPPLAAISVFSLTFGFRQYMDVTDDIPDALRGSTDRADALARHVVRIALPDIYRKLFP